MRVCVCVDLFASACDIPLKLSSIENPITDAQAVAEYIEMYTPVYSFMLPTSDEPPTVISKNGFALFWSSWIQPFLFFFFNNLYPHNTRDLSHSLTEVKQICGDFFFFFFLKIM